MLVTVQSERIAKIRSEILSVGFFEDVRPLTGYAAEIDWVTNGAISNLIQQNKIRGTLGEATLLATAKIETPKILLIGLGEKRKYGLKILRQLAIQVLEMLARLKAHDSTAELWGQEECALDLASCLDIILDECVGHRRHLLPGESPPLLTLLTHHSDRIRELNMRILETERTRALPAPPAGRAEGFGVVRAETKH